MERGARTRALIAINLIPVPPLDGAEAWKLPGPLARHRGTRRGGAQAAAGFAFEREAANLDRYADEPSQTVKTAVDEALRDLASGPKKPGI